MGWILLKLFKFLVGRARGSEGRHRHRLRPGGLARFNQSWVFMAKSSPQTSP